MPRELTFEAFTYSKRIKLLLKREVNNETFFESLRLYYQIYYNILLQAVYTRFFVKDKTLHKILPYINVYIWKVGMPPHIP